MKKLVLLLLVCFLCFLLPVSAVASSGNDNNAEMAIADAVLARPIGLASIVIGTAVFVVTLPFAAFSGTVKQTADTLVGAPCRFTFTRPLGDFEKDGSY